MTITGGCLCRAVRFEITETPFRADYCHCHICQKVSGSVVTAWVDVSQSAFQCTSGEIRFYKSSEHAERGFCAECGSTLVFRQFGADHVAVASGALDRPEDFPMDGHCGVESQVPWLKIDDDMPRKTSLEAMGFEVE